MRLFVFTAAFAVMLTGCCVRNGLQRSTAAGERSFYARVNGDDSLRNITAMFVSDSTFTEIEVKEFCTSAAGDTIFPVKNKKIMLGSRRMASVKGESESFFKMRSGAEGAEKYSADEEVVSVSPFLSGLGIAAVILVFVCVIVLVCFIKNRRG